MCNKRNLNIYTFQWDVWGRKRCVLSRRYSFRKANVCIVECMEIVTLSLIDWQFLCIFRFLSNETDLNGKVKWILLNFNIVRNSMRCVIVLKEKYDVTCYCVFPWRWLIHNLWCKSHNRGQCVTKDVEWPVLCAEMLKNLRYAMSQSKLPDTRWHCTLQLRL